MPASRSRLKQAVREALLDDDDVRSRASSVHGRHFEDPDVETPEMPSVIFEYATGSAMYNRVVHTDVLEFYAYSKVSQDEADLLYDEVHAALHAECVRLTAGDGSTIIAAVLRETTAPTPGYNKVLRAWFTRGRFAIGAVS